MRSFEKQFLCFVQTHLSAADFYRYNLIRLLLKKRTQTQWKINKYECGAQSVIVGTEFLSRNVLQEMFHCLFKTFQFKLIALARFNI